MMLGRSDSSIYICAGPYFDVAVYSEMRLSADNIFLFVPPVPFLTQARDNVRLNVYSRFFKLILDRPICILIQIIVYSTIQILMYILINNLRGISYINTLCYFLLFPVPLCYKCISSEKHHHIKMIVLLR